MILYIALIGIGYLTIDHSLGFGRLMKAFNEQRRKSQKPKERYTLGRNIMPENADPTLHELIQLLVAEEENE